MKDINVLTDILDEQLIKNNIREPREFDEENITYSPSSISYCMRKVFYQMRRYESIEFKPRVYRIFDNGTGFHERMESLFETTDLSIAHELVLSDKTLDSNPLCINGRTDSIIKNPLIDEPKGKTIILKGLDDDENPIVVYEGPSDAVMVLEYKSISMSKFRNKIVSRPLQEHVDQILLYMHETGIEYGILFYENKNDQDWKIFLVTMDQDRMNYIIDRVKRTLYHVKENIVPEREYEELDFECIGCNYRDICRPDSYKFPKDDL